MVMRLIAIFGHAVLLVALATTSLAADGNRLAYLDASDPFYASRPFPKLVTPQWVGEEGVEAVVILSIDDMREHERWEAFLRPILERLKQIDGRAPVSIMTCQIDPRQPHLQKWLAEGLSLETHTYRSSLPAVAKRETWPPPSRTYERCVDQMDAVPGSRARGVSHALLRFAKLAQPAVLCRDLQPHDARGQLSRDRQLGVQHHHGQRSGVAARAGASTARRRKSFAATCRSSRTS